MMTQTSVSLPKGSGSRQRLRTALTTIHANFSDLYTRVTAIEEAEGPEWLPEGAISYADFVNGNYYAGGDEVEFGDVISGGTVSGTGLNVAGAVRDFLGDFRDSLLVPEWTVVLKFRMVTSDTQYIFSILDNPTYYNNYWLTRNATGALVIADASYDGGRSVGAATGFPFALNVWHKAAVTRTDTKVSISVNGGAFSTDAGGALPVHETHPLTRATLGPEFAPIPNMDVESFLVLPVQADAALPALSTQ
jgi:hypothetical protein